MVFHRALSAFVATAQREHEAEKAAQEKPSDAS
jgi:hypothetical protein